MRKLFELNFFLFSSLTGSDKYCGVETREKICKLVLLLRTSIQSEITVPAQVLVIERNTTFSLTCLWPLTEFFHDMVSIYLFCKSYGALPSGTTSFFPKMDVRILYYASMSAHILHRNFY